MVSSKSFKIIIVNFGRAPMGKAIYLKLDRSALLRVRFYPSRKKEV